MEIKQLVSFYYSLGMNHKEILVSLAQLNQIIISIRTLRRILNTCRLFRKKHFTNILDVALYLVECLHSNDKLCGYKMVHLKCIQKGLVVKQETVRLLLQIIDPDGVESRKKRRIKRRIYHNKGPNQIWHVDSYDKLKPYGICINGAIDGYSRNIMWLRAYTTNSDPRVIAGYFMNTVRMKGGCPARIRTDMGTENGHMRDMQRAMRWEHEDEFARKCFIYGASTHNQRIEAWWGFLRTHNAQYWMDVFMTLKEEDHFIGDYLDKNLVQFVFLKIIQVCRYAIAI